MPDFQEDLLRRGHAVHFRCGIEQANGIRVDVMSNLRGVVEFEKLWERRTTLADKAGTEYHLLALQELVQAKKTQRDKDWPMIARLVEANYYAHRDHLTQEQLRYWLHEMRTPELLIEIVRPQPGATGDAIRTRSLLELASLGEVVSLERALLAEPQAERDMDRSYWKPLKMELEELRMARHQKEDLKDARRCSLRCLR